MNTYRVKFFPTTPADGAEGQIVLARSEVAALRKRLANGPHMGNHFKRVEIELVQRGGLYPERLRGGAHPHGPGGY